ncbi:hypothetical protein SNE25_24475 [Mucilaginibacter sabulilitoris]|uniref:Uncharacterized protein n=1 Tax=Mucilaginibacter sabulilitoris TaxID=1173583 RepID=A0ABZ0THR0_9SPHI|nr:hypothetical protein [Mucilaginibacter sabulilitoris]WPU92487.1 hypothetical protein SNE25_24475 [Mucilaginibacter sabulilitoris]
MVPLVFKNDEKFDALSFYEYLLTICEKHKDESRALAFAFLIYDFKDHTVNKILKDKSYWNALDAISGKFLSIFYIDSADRYYKKRHQEIYRERIKEQNSRSGEGAISFFVPIVLKPTPIERAGPFLKDSFVIDKAVKTPLVLFFQTNNNAITDSFIVELKEEKLEDAFIELKDLIKEAAAALSGVEEKYLGNDREIFNLLKEGVKSKSFLRVFNKKKDAVLKIGSILSLLKLLAGIFS